MAEPITIGGQTFIKTAEGWVDKKTKAKAPEGLTALLDKMQSEESPEAKKTRVRIDTSRQPVVFGGAEYVWDLNGKVWIDKKTKVAANARFSVLIESAYKQAVTSNPDFLYEKNAPQPTREESQAAVKKNISEAIFSNTGAVGQAAKAKAKKTSGKGTLQLQNKKINSPLVVMIEKLASIDGYLKQRLENQKAIADKNVSAIREQSIETVDAQKINPTVEGDKKEGKSNAAAIIAAVGLGAIIAAQFEPVRDAFKTVVDFSKSVYSFFGGAVDIMNNALKSLLGIKTSVPENVGGEVNLRQQTTSTQQNVTPPPRSVTEDQRPAQMASNVSGGEGNINTTQRSSIETGGSPAGSSQTTPMPAPTYGTSSNRGMSMTAGAPSAVAAAAPAVSPPTETVAPVAKPVEDTRNWWQRTMPKFLGGEDAPTQDAEPVGDAPSNDIVGLGKYLQGQGLRVSGHSQFGGQERGKHAENSRHYTDQALDVNVGTDLVEANDPAAGAKFDALRKQLEGLGYNVIWRSSDHYDHMHVSVGGPEGPSGGESKSMLQKAAGISIDALAGAGKLFKSVGRELVGDRSFLSLAARTADPSKAIGTAAITRMSEIAATRSEKPDLPPPPAIPNLNSGKPDAPIYNPPTTTDRIESVRYVERLGLHPG